MKRDKMSYVHETYILGWQGEKTSKQRTFKKFHVDNMPKNLKQNDMMKKNMEIREATLYYIKF